MSASSENKRGAVLSWFPNGYGFVRELADPNDFSSSHRDCPNHFYHITRSPKLDPESIYVGMVVDFEVLTSEVTWRTQAIQLTPVEFATSLEEEAT